MPKKPKGLSVETWRRSERIKRKAKRALKGPNKSGAGVPRWQVPAPDLSSASWLDEILNKRPETEAGGPPPQEKAGRTGQKSVKVKKAPKMR